MISSYPTYAALTGTFNHIKYVTITSCPKGTNYNCKFMLGGKVEYGSVHPDHIARIIEDEQEVVLLKLEGRLP